MLRKAETTQPPLTQLRLSSFSNKVRKVSRQPDNSKIKISNTSANEFVLSKGFTYILECADGTFYTGSTKDLEKRIWQHNNGIGANYTKTRLPADLVYYEEYIRIDEAFYREKQIQGWSRNKKLALIKGKPELLPKLAKKTFKK